MSSSKKISELVELELADDDDLIAVVDTSAEETKYIQKSNLVSSGTGVERLTTESVVDDSNLTFVFTKEPTYLIINGVMYPKGVGIFSWSWDTLTATLAVPIGTGGFIEGLVL